MAKFVFLFIFCLKINFLLSNEISTSISSSSLSLNNLENYENFNNKRTKRRYEPNIKKDLKKKSSSAINYLNNNEKFCVFGDTCGSGGGISGDSSIPCKIKKKPSYINDTETLEVLRTICPSLFVNTDYPEVCCSVDQIQELEQNFANPRDLGMGKCPGCMTNFQTLHCEMSCSPRQSDFIEIVDYSLVEPEFLETTTESNDENKNETNLTKKELHYVKEINYFVDKDFITTLYESCRNVKSVIGGQLIDVLCGVPPCSAFKWVKFIGTSYLKKGFSPIQINYIPVENQFYQNQLTFNSINENNLKHLDKNIISSFNMSFIEPMNFKPYQCYERVSIDQGSCVCSDCQQTCDVLKKSALPSIEKSFLISGQNFTIFLSWLLFTIVTISVFIYFVFVAKHKNQKLENKFGQEKQNQSKPSCSDSSDKSLKDFENKDQFVLTLGLKIERYFQNFFERWGYYVATNPLKVLFTSLFISIILALGIVNYKITTDPVDLWVATGSEARKDMEYFNENFWKFYRIEQIILTPKKLYNFTGSYLDDNNDMIKKVFSSLFKEEVLREAFEIQQSIEKLTAKNTKTNQIISLKDICYMPLAGKCATQSIFSYFENNMTNLDDQNYLERITICPDNPTFMRGDFTCMEKGGIPLVYPEVALGGFKEKNYLLSKALIITFPVNNYKNFSSIENALEWEKTFIDFVQEYIDKNKNTTLFDISYKVERSIEDELNRQSESDVGTVVVSYIIMFLYILIALGENDKRCFLLNSKCTIGLAGILIVILSVISSIGVFFYFGVPCTLIIVEVIPFLVLAVGIDNIFILIQTFCKDTRLPGENAEDQIGRVCGDVFPSMLLSSLSMCTCFLVGSYTPMPAVQKFALYAAVALFINFFLQATCFMAFFVLDVRRSESNRFDIFCCFKSTKKCQNKNMNNNTQENNQESFESSTVDKTIVSKPKTGLQDFFAQIYAPFIMKDHVRMFVIIIFSFWLCSSLMVISSIHVGLEQDLTMPDDSYMSKFFKMYTDFYEVGPPVYFMIKNKGYDLSLIENQNRICSLHNCETNSLLQVLSYWSDKQKIESYLTTTPSYFLDNYINYLQNPSCCLEYSNGTQCFNNLNEECKSCIPDLGKKRPNSDQFKKYLDFFFNHVPNEQCLIGGRAQYFSSVNYDDNKNIQASYIVTYNSPLKTSEDFYEALKQSRLIAEKMTISLRRDLNDSDVEVRPYSFPHVFYEQYLTMWQDTIISISMSIGIIFLVNFLFFGFDYYTAFISSLTILIMTINLMGMMYWWNISLNAISLVNLVVGVGIFVEFVSHLLTQYKLSSESTKLLRARDCLAKMGASVLSGITLTDCGILVLVFAKSKIFQVFYFRMYLGMIAIGTVHSLIFLPVFLSIFGPPLDKNRIIFNKIKENERNKKFLDNKVYSV